MSEDPLPSHSGATPNPHTSSPNASPSEPNPTAPNPTARPIPSSSAAADAEGGLHAPRHLSFWGKAWWWFDFIVLVNLARLRFVAILVVIGVVITQWDTLVAYYERWTRPASEEPAKSSGIEYFCPMHPAIVRDTPKEKCPICFMPLSKRKKGSAVAEALPAGVVNRVQLSPYRVVLAGAEVQPLDFQPLSKEIEAIGYIEFDERGQRTVSARIAGRIDRLFVNETGPMVDAGDELALLYSPELLVTVQNLLDARRSGNQSLLDGARTRLDLLGIDAAQIDEILASGKAEPHVKIRSPISGHIIAKNVREGQYVAEGTVLYELADLSTVWIQAQVYEDDMAFLPTRYLHGARPVEGYGLKVSARTPAFPNQVFQGELAFIYPHVDQNTRTVTVRFELANPGHQLRPGSTASVTLEVAPRDLAEILAADQDPERMSMLAAGRVLAVPESAVIDTGSQKIVYRQAEPGVFEGVEVQLAPRMSDANQVPFYPVLAGLARGDAIVVRGSFLIDAETRLNPSAGSIYFGGSGGSQAAAPNVTTVRPSTPEDPEAKVRAAFARLSPADRALAAAQGYCPVLTDSRLGSMGVPIKVVVNGEPVFLCCQSCQSKALANPTEILRAVRALKAQPASPSAAKAAPVPQTSEPSPVATAAPSTPAIVPSTESTAIKPAALTAREAAEIEAELAKLSPADRKLAAAQVYCVVATKSRLGSMGPPIKLMAAGEAVFICCEGCASDVEARPAEFRDVARGLRAAHGPKQP